MNTNSFYRSGFKVHIEPFESETVKSVRYEPTRFLYEPKEDNPHHCVLSYMNLRGTEDLSILYRRLKLRFRQSPGFVCPYKAAPCAAVFASIDDAANLMEQLVKEGCIRYEFQMYYYD